MPNTFTLISTTTVGAGGAASIDFTSIPNTGLYTDLQVVISHRSTANQDVDDLRIKINGVSTNLSNRTLQGTGSSVSSESGTAGKIGVGNGAVTTSNTFSSTVIYIPNYAGSTNKSFSSELVMENNGTVGFQNITTGLWSNTAAITSLSFVSASAANFAQYSTASLYGILKGSGGATVS